MTTERSTILARTRAGGSRSGGDRQARGFTLIELLVVISIIAFISAIAFILAHRVTGGGKARITQDAIRILDTLVTSYQGDVSAKLPTVYTDAQGVSYPIVDARLRNFTPATTVYNLDTNPAEPSLGLFLLAIADSANVTASLKSLDTRLVSSTVLTSQSGANPSPRDKSNNPILASVIKDGWGRPIRFVHPKFDGGYGDYFKSNGSTWTSQARPFRSIPSGGAEFSRSIHPYNPVAPASVPLQRIGDADEGVCVGAQPYFYSAGEDGDPGTREGNVYTTKPTYPAETAKEP